MAAVFKEVLRLYPIAPATARVTTKTEKIGDFNIPAGSTIFVPFYTVHRHPKYWEDPDSFDPDRFSLNEENSTTSVGVSSTAGQFGYKYIPFSAGPRVCIGQYFAMLEAKLTLAIIMKKYDWKVVGDEGKTGDPNIPIAENLTIRPSSYQITLFDRK
jgi:cytochrome P450